MHILINLLRPIRSLIPIVWCLVLFTPALSAQKSPNRIAVWLEEHRQSPVSTPVSLFEATVPNNDLSTTLRESTVLRLDENALDGLLHDAPTTMTLQIPQGEGLVELELAKVSILSPGFRVGTLGQYAQENVPVHDAVHYRGIVKGDPQSVAAISLTSSGLMGMFADDAGNWQIGQIEDASGQYVLYRSADLLAQNPHSCATDDVTMHIGSEEPTVDERGIGCKTVEIYFECDYKLFQDKGSSVNNATNYVTALFNQISALYAVENVGVAISEIYVWSSPDPYQSFNSTASVLNAFKANKGTNFNGNLAHFLSTRSLGGGIAYVDVICVKSFAFGVSGIQATFQNVPTYSWSVEVVTHELGHNLGSPHTQSCTWPGGAIDNCVNTEGGCAPGPAPVGGGTIMSYCHLTSYGINFNNGFGPLPGNKIRDRVLAATCAQQNSGNPPTNLSATNITGSSVLLTWDPVTGAAVYTVQYKPVTTNNWINAGTSTAASLPLSGLTNNQNYDWQVKTDCSSYSGSSSFTTNSNGGGNGGGGNCTVVTGLAATNLTQTGATLSWTAVAGATGYDVEYKTGSASTWLAAGTVTGTSYALQGLSANTSYNARVKANCSAFASPVTFTTSSAGGGTGCSAPTGMTTTAITQATATLNWDVVQGATSYTVQYKKSTATSWFTAGTVTTNTTNLQNLLAGTNYHWRVKANCSAYTSNVLFTTSLNNGGGGPVLTCSAPTGLTNVFVGANTAVIRWTAVSGALNYTLQIKLTTSSVWFTLGTVSVTQVSLISMSSNTSYQWRVKANCSGYSLPVTLNTLASLQGSDGTNAFSEVGISVEEGNMEIFPNPASDWLTLRYVSENATELRYVILDATGKVVASDLLLADEQRLSIGKLSAGIYVLTLYNAKRPLATRRFVKGGM
jgi:hypothetical protein